MDELSHVFAKTPSHSDNFWDIAIRLYLWANISPSQILAFEERFQEDVEQALIRQGILKYEW